jgi:hypothetical protein
MSPSTSRGVVLEVYLGGLTGLYGASWSYLLAIPPRAEALPVLPTSPSPFTNKVCEFRSALARPIAILYIDQGSGMNNSELIKQRHSTSLFVESPVICVGRVQ